MNEGGGRSPRRKGERRWCLVPTSEPIFQAPYTCGLIGGSLLDFATQSISGDQHATTTITNDQSPLIVFVRLALHYAHDRHRPARSPPRMIKSELIGRVVEGYAQFSTANDA